MFDYRYPHTDFNEYNLDWLVERVKTLTNDWLETKEAWENTEAEWTELYNYVHDYFDNLDVSTEVGEIIDDYRQDGTLTTICQPIVDHWVEDHVPRQIDQWLDANIAHETGYVLDSSLTLANAAAPANLVGNINDALDDLYDHSANVLNLDTFEQGYLLADGTVDTTDAGAHTTDYILIQGEYLTYTAFIESAYETQLKTIRAVAFYDANKTFISRDTSNLSTYAMINNAVYVRCSITGSLYGYDMLSFTSTKLSKWIPYRSKPSSYYSPIYGKSMLCVGDSICKGENWVDANTVYPNSNTGWAKIFKDSYKMQVYGYGISGATIRKITDNTNSVYEQFSQFVYYATAHNYVPDYILLEGGINDATRYYNGDDTDADFGEFVSGYGQSNYYTTTIGALERMFYTAKVTFPNTKILYIVPHHCSGDGFQPTLQKYIEAIKDACDKWSIPYIDLYTKGRLNGCITALRSEYFDEYGVHPNEAGYEVMTDDIIPMMLDY